MQEKINTNVLNSFSASISKAVKDSGLTKRTFAQKAGLSPAALNNYLLGRLPKLEEAIKLANFLGMTVDELIYGKASEPGESAAVWKHKFMETEKRLSGLKKSLASLVKNF
jgi:transcriptional regulator with XRE-family HTH domain